MSADTPPAPEQPAPDPLLEKLLAASRAVKPVPKAGENVSQKYSYARAEDVITEARRALHEAGLVAVIDFAPAGSSDLTSSSGSKGLLVRVNATLRVFDPESGRALTVTGAGTGSDYPGDKAIYKAQTGAAKYLYASTLGIPFGDDPESGDHVESRGSPAASSKPAAEPKGFREQSQSSAFMDAFGSAARSDEERRKVFAAVNGALTAAQIDNAGSQLLDERYRAGAVRRIRELAGLEPLDLSVPDTRDLPDVNADVASSQAPLVADDVEPAGDPDPDDLFADQPTDQDPSL